MANFNLNELTLDDIGHWPNPVKYAVLAIIFSLIVGLGYWIIIARSLEEYDSLVREEKNLKQQFERKQYLASNLQAYKNQIAIMQEKFGDMLRQLPTKNEMPGLLEDISKTGIASGLVFESFAPEPEVIHDFYIELPIKIAVLGNYHQLAVFLSRVAQMRRIVTLHDFQVTVADKEKQKENNDLLLMKLTAKIYRYRT